MISVLTAIYDDYDELKTPVDQTVPCEFVCITDDRPLHAGLWNKAGWMVRYVPNPGIHPNLAAKIPKCYPQLYAHSRTVVWLDAAFAITEPDTIERLVETSIGFAVSQFVHPWRDCIYAEAGASWDLPKYEGQPVLEQAQCYMRAGHPSNWGLWETGVIVWHLSERAEQFGHAWYEQCSRWSFQDQVSEAFVLRQHTIFPHSLGPSSREFHGLSYEPSVRHG